MRKYTTITDEQAHTAYEFVGIDFARRNVLQHLLMQKAADAGLRTYAASKADRPATALKIMDETVFCLATAHKHKGIEEDKGIVKLLDPYETPTVRNVIEQNILYTASRDLRSALQIFNSLNGSGTHCYHQQQALLNSKINNMPGKPELRNTINALSFFGEKSALRLLALGLMYNVLTKKIDVAQLAQTSSTKQTDLEFDKATKEIFARYDIPLEKYAQAIRDPAFNAAASRVRALVKKRKTSAETPTSHP